MVKTLKNDELAMPAPGTDVWYRLRINDELVRATVIDAWAEERGGTEHLIEPEPDTVHLEVRLDRRRHFAAANRALRLNVREGDEPGQFQRTYPKGETEAWKQKQLRREIEHDLNVQRAQGRQL